VTEEEKRKFSGIPTPPLRPPSPPVPQINPKVKEFMEQPLTVVDCQFILANMKGRLEKKFEEIAEKASEQGIEKVVYDPALIEVQKDILKCEEVITQGYAVQYTPPVLRGQQNPQSEESILDRLDEMWSLFDQIDPELKGKMGKTLGKLFDMLNEKMGVE